MNIRQAFKALWLWRRNQVWGFVEAVGFTLIILGFLHYINPTNPLFVKEGFPWPWIAPVILMFQYGFGPSIVSVAIISIAAVSQRHIGVISIGDFQIYLISGVALILICGLFSASWVRRMLDAEAMLAYTSERLASLSSSYYMLHVSNSYLEQNIITKPATLRSALQELQKINLHQGTLLSYEVAYAFLQVLSQFCSIESLGIYLYKNDILSSDPFVEMGSVGKLIQNDPLIKTCLELDEICYVSVSQIEDMNDCSYIIAMPLNTHNKERLGLLVIKEISFWNLTDEILRVLSILVHYFMQNTVLGPNEEKLLHHYPFCTLDFVRQLITLTTLKRDLKVDSALVAIMVSNTMRKHNVIYNLKSKCRTLDSWCTLEMDKYDVLLTLMPHTDAAGINGYLSRTNHYLTADLGLSLENDNIKSRSMQLDGSDSLSTMQYFIHFIEEKNIAK